MSANLTIGKGAFIIPSPSSDCFEFIRGFLPAQRNLTCCALLEPSAHHYFLSTPCPIVSWLEREA